MATPIAETVVATPAVEAVERPVEVRWTTEQPKSFVYFIRQGNAGPIKIGLSKDPPARLRDLQTAHSEPLSMLAMVPGGPNLEIALHAEFKQYRLMGEWFVAAPAIFKRIDSLLGT